MYELALGDSVVGAFASASAAVNAGVSVDFVLAVAFADAAQGASVCANAAADASVGDNICHSDTSKIDCMSILSCFSEKANEIL